MGAGTPSVHEPETINESRNIGNGLDVNLSYIETGETKQESCWISMGQPVRWLLVRV